MASVEIARRLGDLGGEAVSIGNLGVVQHLVADLTGSVDRYREALGHYESDLEFRAVIGDRFGTIARRSTRRRCTSASASTTRRSGDREGLLASPPSNFARHCSGVSSRPIAGHVGQLDDGLDLLALVRNHPAAQRGDLQDIERILERASLPPVALDGRPVTDSSDDLEAVVQAILDR